MKAHWRRLDSLTFGMNVPGGIIISCVSSVDSADSVVFVPNAHVEHSEGEQYADMLPGAPDEK